MDGNKARKMSFDAFEKQFYLQQSSTQLSLIDSNGILIFSNDVVVNLKEYIGKNIFEVDPLIASLEELLTSLPLDAEPMIFPRVEMSSMDEDQNIFDYEIYKREINNTEYIVWLIRDLSDEKKFLQDITTSQRSAMIQNELLEIQNKNIALEKELMQLRNNELERQQSFRNEFFSKASHEIRSPVNGIIGMADILHQTATTDQKEYVSSLKFLSNHLRYIVNDLLDLAKLEAGKIKTEKIDFDLYELINTTKHSFQPQCDSKLIGLNTEINPEVPRKVKGDSLRLSQLLFNLVSNAIKFTEKGGVSIHVYPEAENIEKDEFLINFEVIDTGKGIAKEKLETIFEPFSQEEESTTRKYGGTGLGLTIVKQIVDVLGGKVWVESELGQGSTFGFNIPLLLSEAKVRTETALDPAIKATLKDAKVLIVDDSKINLMIFSKYLKGTDLQITKAESGREALNLLDQQRFDLAVFDLEMPEMNGAMLLQEVRKRPEGKQMPIIIYSGHTPSDMVQLYGELDYDDLLPKPSEKSEMIRKLAKNLSSRISPEEEFKAALQRIKDISAGNDAFQRELIPHLRRTMDQLRNALKVANEKHDLGLIEAAMEKGESLIQLIGLDPVKESVEELKTAIREGQTQRISQTSRRAINSIARFVQAIPNG